MTKVASLRPPFLMKNKLDINKIIKELSRDEFPRKATKVFPSKKRENNKKNTREILRDSEED